MPISIIDNFDVNAPKNIDARLGPYDTTANALASIDEVTQRYLGLTVLVTGSGIPTEYWFQDGVTDSDLVLKPIGSAVGFPYSGSDSLNNDPQQALITGSLYLSGSGHITASGDISASGNLFALASDGASISHVALYNTSSGQFFYTASNALSTQANTLQQVTDQGNTTTNDIIVTGSLYQSGSVAYFQPNEFAVDALGDTVFSVGQLGTQDVKIGMPSTSTEIKGPLTASIISASGNLFASASDGTGISHVALYNTSSGQFFYTASSAIGGGITPSQTGSFLTTASAEFSEITFTKGDASTFLVDSTPRRVIETVKNLESFTLPKGTPVYASGSTGNSIHVYAASASLSSRMPAAYILNNDLTSGQEGIGILSGFANGLDTSTFAEGDVLYVAADGGYTNIKPTGSNLIQNLGKVIVSDATNGSIVSSGAGRANDVPNITPGYFWLGNSDSVATPTATSSIQNVVSSSYATTASYALGGVVPTLQQVTDEGNTTTNDITITGSLITSGSLQVKGSGNTFATTPILIENSDGDDLIKVLDSGRFFIGKGANNAADTNVVYGNSANAQGSNNIAIGNSAQTQGGQFSIAIGGTVANVNYGIGIGSAYIGGAESVGIGYSSRTSAGTVAIGHDSGPESPGDGEQSIYIGNEAKGTADNSIVLNANGGSTISSATETNSFKVFMSSASTPDFQVTNTHITASGAISASGNLFASASDGTGISHVALYNTSSGQFFYTASNAIGRTLNLQQVTDEGATTTNDITITGSLIVSSSNSTASLTLEGSGSTVFEIIGSEGTLFSVDDDLDGIIFTANDRSGLPVLQASASGEVYIGKAPQSLYTTAVISSTTAATTQSIYGLSTSSYGGAFVDYMVQSGSNARAGNMMAVWNGSNINFTETTTTDIGDTTDFNIIVHISQSQAQIASHATNAGYNIKTIIRSI